MAQDAARCHVCWGRAALDPEALPHEIGGYEILGRLGRGAHGRVYRARQRGAGKLVALKVIWDGEPERELKHHVRLAHPHIVTVHDGGGLDHDPPYFAMELIEGGTLAERLDDFRAPERALALVIDVAHAIESAHQHLVLHRDLKPTNILIDPSGRALVSDFSVAKEIDGAEPGPTQTMAGTVPYMSPEQAGIVAAPVSTASDVYGLGAILYELLTGGPPRPVETLDELKASFATHDLPPPITTKGVSCDLQAVCMRALSKDRDARYQSAALLAEDLQRVLRDEPLPWRPWSLRERVGRWVRRSPWLAATIALGTLLLSAINVMTFNSVREQEAELRQLVLKTNAALAKAQAQAALAEFVKLEREIARATTAAAPLLESYLRLPPEDPDRPELALALPGFDSLFVAGCDGHSRAHSFDDRVRERFPEGPPGYFATSYRFRDYFRAATELGARGSREIYVSRAFRSTWDQRIKFAFSTPVYASDDRTEPCIAGTRMIGIFFAGRSASSTLGHVQIPELEGSGQRTALFGPRDRDSASEPLPPASELYVLVHEKLRLGDEQRMDSRLAKRLSERFAEAAPPGRQFEASRATPYQASDYVDALDDTHSRWLGGFYPVGKTGFVVGVQTAYGTATAPVRRIETLLLLNVAFFAFCLSALWLTLRKPSTPGFASMPG